eukprot:TRINITY_DN10558_c0_g1_i3.p3 TRINITY_DN10558_c0_g1~~TRINITY_DN10558_c0_g1_i3.p3  ORF type:complete len:151 (-),score=22.60 TRINITY_DN10558_c0_g1_i3:1232-1684(-)
MLREPILQISSEEPDPVGNGFGSSVNSAIVGIQSEASFLPILQQDAGVARFANVLVHNHLQWHWKVVHSPSISTISVVIQACQSCQAVIGDSVLQRSLAAMQHGQVTWQIIAIVEAKLTHGDRMRLIGPLKVELQTANDVRHRHSLRKVG